jgi:hypothetical protein
MTKQQSNTILWIAVAGLGVGAVYFFAKKRIGTSGFGDVVAPPVAVPAGGASKLLGTWSCDTGVFPPASRPAMIQFLGRLDDICWRTGDDYQRAMRQFKQVSVGLRSSTKDAISITIGMMYTYYSASGDIPTLQAVLITAQSLHQHLAAMTKSLSYSKTVLDSGDVSSLAGWGNQLVSLGNSIYDKIVKLGGKPPPMVWTSITIPAPPAPIYSVPSTTRPGAYQAHPPTMRRAP